MSSPDDGRPLKATIKASDAGPGDEPRFCAILSRAGDPPRSTSPASGQAAAALSARELEIAARLFISENTLKTHVRHIYRKTGTRDRWELGACLEEARGQMPSCAASDPEPDLESP